MNRKFILTDEVKIHNYVTLHRIQAVRSFGDVSEGELGGWVEREENLSHIGNCWVYDEAIVFDYARVEDNACIRDHAELFGHAILSHECQILDEAIVFGEAMVYDRAVIKEMAHVSDHATVYEDSIIFGSAKICGYASIHGRAKVYDQAVAYGNAVICEASRVCENSQIYGKAYLGGSGIVHGDAFVYGAAYLFGEYNIKDSFDVLQLGPVKNKWLENKIPGYCYDFFTIYFSGGKVSAHFKNKLLPVDSWIEIADQVFDSVDEVRELLQATAKLLICNR